MKDQTIFADNKIIRFLVCHLAFETVEEHGKYTVVSKQTMPCHQHHPQASIKDDTTTNEGNGSKSSLAALQGKSWFILRHKTESRALLCVAILLEKGADNVQSYSAMTQLLS
ncbi:hypothetical protein V6N13_105924 [Hibiscus sabdariffa]|uniref:Uncharacterized protein n=1 Tax=Hibiscus sabdariffa TaxID=183260 RepID=A0ABR2EZ72_9ROSI